MFNFKKKIDKAEEMRVYDYEFLARLFGIEDAKKHLLNVVTPPNPDADTVLRDSQALESMMSGHGWTVYEKAIWLKLLGALRQSLGAKSVEEREAGRNQVLAHLATLHLPYEMRFAADNIKKMKELEKSFKDTLVG